VKETPRPHVDMRLDKVLHGPSHLPALVFPGSIRRLVLAVVLSIAFAVGGVWLVVSSRDDTVVYVAIVMFFGAAALVGLWGVVRDVGSVALSSAGVHGGSRSEVYVPWAAIRSAIPMEVKGEWGEGTTWMVGLDVTDPSAVRMPRRLRAVRSMNRGMFGVDLAVGGPTDQQRAEAIGSVITYYAAEPGRRHEIGRVLPPAAALTADNGPDTGSLVG
jgi:hypothetical protein